MIDDSFEPINNLKSSHFAERPVLDHGYLKLVEVWGSDRMIIESARMSTQKGFDGWGPKHDPECPWESGECVCDKDKPGDEKLLAYLWKNKHSTPFEFAGLTIEVQAPIFVFREWHRHRVPFGYSEASARYAPLPALDFVPSVERCMKPGPARNKQAASAADAPTLTTEAATLWLDRLEQAQTQLEELYQDGLACGIPKELARLAMTVGRYTRMRATGNLRGWLAFLALRLPETAQEEIRDYAREVRSLVQLCFPRTLEVAEKA